MTLPIIPDHEPPAVKNTFPIVVQLVVLGLFLSGIFGLLWWSSQDSTPQPTEREYKTVPLYTATAAPTAIMIDDIALQAKAAYVFDVKSQRALYAKNESEPLPLASITKLMTALLAHELIVADELVTIPSVAIAQEGDSGLQAGELFTAEQLSEFSLLSSSNDAAYTLAASVGNLLGQRDPAEQFVAGMNIRARELGLNSLEFKNMTGLDVSTTEPGAIGTAKDVSFLLEYIILNYPEILTPTQEPSSRVYNDDGAYHDLSNTNPVVDQIPNLIGSKTGYTDLAGGNLTVAFELGLDRPIIITVLGSTRDARFSDVLTLVTAIQTSTAN